MTLQTEILSIVIFNSNFRFSQTSYFSQVIFFLATASDNRLSAAPHAGDNRLSPACEAGDNRLTN